MKNNKPIRYTTMQVYDSYNYSDIPIYIVTKCFLDEEVTKYLMNGKTRKEYKVTFPYSLNNRNCEYDMQYNWQDYNRKIVNKVFDNYEDAKRYTDELNKKMLSEKISSVGILSEVKNIKNYYNKKIKVCEELESKILSNTKFLTLNNNVKNQETIISDDTKTNITDLSIYNIIDLCRNNNFIVYTVSDSVFNTMKEQLNNNNKLPVNYGKCLLVNDSKSHEIRIFNDEDKVYILDSDDNLFMKTEEEINLPSHFDKKIYTMETYEDIINSYSYGANISVSDIKKKVLKK